MIISSEINMDITAKYTNFIKFVLFFIENYYFISAD